MQLGKQRASTRLALPRVATQRQNAKQRTVLQACSAQAPAGTVPTTLYAARGRLIPFNSNSPTGSTFTAFSTFINTRGLMRI